MIELDTPHPTPINVRDLPEISDLNILNYIDY